MDLKDNISAAISTLMEAEAVLDLSCGEGEHVLLAAQKIGPSGKAIGLDSSEDKISAARKRAAELGVRPPHIAFVKTSLAESLPIEPESVDCIFSSAVISLEILSRKEQQNLLNESYRVLKPGGRAIFHGKITGLNHDTTASSGDELTELVRDAGFSNVSFAGVKDDLSQDQPTLSRICATKDGATAVNPDTVLMRWWDAYPVVKSTPPHMTAEEVALLIRASAATPDEKPAFAVVDVRRNDHAGGHVRGSFNRHAQTFYDDLPSVFAEFKDTPRVIFYCQSSNGRGPRCAGWYQDYLDAHPGEHNSQAYVLKGGIKNWLATFKGQEDLIDSD